MILLLARIVEHSFCIGLFDRRQAHTYTSMSKLVIHIHLQIDIIVHYDVIVWKNLGMLPPTGDLR
eukprot:6276444-Amphidinium_carterae.1